MVIVDSAGNQYNLAAPPNNEEVRIDPGTTLEGRFVFSGHLAPGVISQYNQALSEKRAEAVKNDLVQNFGVDASRLQTEGLGESNPVAPNTHADGSDHPENRQKNRRVEVLIQTPQGDV
ncbi:MAG: OmpA family protein [Leptolyngbya sp. SIO1E4]|nr:OmpA family protein [Leptolyngbya sp. SIO1E4]